MFVENVDGATLLGSILLVVGVDEDTAVVTNGDPDAGGQRSFTVAGRQSAWVLDPEGARTRYPAGSAFVVPAATRAR